MSQRHSAVILNHLSLKQVRTTWVKKTLFHHEEESLKDQSIVRSINIPSCIIDSECKHYYNVSARLLDEGRGDITLDEVVFAVESLDASREKRRRSEVGYAR
jgi:hypothetical protein